MLFVPVVVVADIAVAIGSISCDANTLWLVMVDANWLPIVVGDDPDEDDDATGADGGNVGNINDGAIKCVGLGDGVVLNSPL